LTAHNSFQTLACPQCGAGLPSAADNVICQYCGTRLIRTPAGPAGAAETLAQGMRFSPHICMDVGGTGLEAFRVLIPSGWQVNGGVVWLPDNPSMPATLGYQIYNPAGAEALEVFPTLPFYWFNDPLSLMALPMGSRYFGCEVHPPLPVIQAMKQITLPRFRNIAGLIIAKEELVPDLPRQVAGNATAQTGYNPQMEGGHLRIQYPSRLRLAFEEDLIGVVAVTRAGIPSMFGYTEIISWQLNYQMGFRASFGQLDQLADLFRTIITSFQLNPRWYATIVQMGQYMTQNQIQRIHDIGQMSRSFSQTANQIGDAQVQGYY